MGDFQKLSKAPIILAVLEIRFAIPETMTLKKMAGLKPILKKEYPVQVARNTAQFSFDLGKNPRQINLEQDAHVFTSASKKHEILLTQNTYSFFQHGSYDTWASFKKQGLADWSRCRDFIKPLGINRISLRYINSIDLPYPAKTEQLQDAFFRTQIVGPYEKKSIAQYALRFTHPPDEKKVTVHFAQELKFGVPGVFPFIVDIDVLYEPGKPINEDQVERKFDELREIKNQYFFRNLTESTLNMLK